MSGPMWTEAERAEARARHAAEIEVADRYRALAERSSGPIEIDPWSDEVVALPAEWFEADEDEVEGIMPDEAEVARALRAGVDRQLLGYARAVHDVMVTMEEAYDRLSPMAEDRVFRAHHRAFVCLDRVLRTIYPDLPDLPDLCDDDRDEESDR